MSLLAGCGTIIEHLAISHNVKPLRRSAPDNFSPLNSGRRAVHPLSRFSEIEDWGRVLKQLASQLWSKWELLHRPTARWGRVFLLSMIAGLLTGLAAAGLYWALHFGSELVIGRSVDASGDHLWVFSWWVLLLPALGGLISGVIVHGTRAEARTHGTNEYINAFHYQSGRLRLRNPAIKAACAVGVISCGGSAGPEGPTAALGAAIGSSLGRRTGVPPAVIRQLLIAGCAGGVGAVFQCPLGGALFAASVLYWEPEFEATGIVPALIASVISYATFSGLMGSGFRLLSGAEDLRFESAWQLLVYAALGIVCGIVAIWLRVCMCGVEKLTREDLKLSPWLSPALGGLFVGVIACALPQVMDAHYLFVQRILDGDITSVGGFSTGTVGWIVFLLVLVLAKCLATGFTAGAGAAGGTLGPVVFIGAMSGALIDALMQAFAPAWIDENLRRSLIATGIAGTLSASMRTPLAAIVMTREMTGSQGLVVPLMLVSVIAYIMGRRFGLNSAQVRSVSQSPVHASDALVHILESFRASELANANWPFQVGPGATLTEMQAMARGDSDAVFLVRDGDQLLGVIVLARVRGAVGAAAANPAFGQLIIAADALEPGVPIVTADDNLYEALETFKRTGLSTLPVVERTGSRRLLGALHRGVVNEAVRERLRQLRGQMADEHSLLFLLEQDEESPVEVNAGRSAQTALRGAAIRRIGVPGNAIGLSLRDADFRRTQGVQVVGIELPDGTLLCPPDVSRPLTGEETLLTLQSLPSNDGAGS